MSEIILVQQYLEFCGWKFTQARVEVVLQLWKKKNHKKMLIAKTIIKFVKFIKFSKTVE